MKRILTILGVVVALGTVAQDKNATKFAKTITPADLKERLTILASDEYEGRETGKKGQKLAANYIAGKFKEFGLEAPVKGSYFQVFDLEESTPGAMYFRKGEEKKTGAVDYIYYSRSETMGEEYIKVVLSKEEADLTPERVKGAFVAFYTAQLGGWDAKLKKAKDAGAAGYIIATEDAMAQSVITRWGPYLSQPQMSLGGKIDDEEADKVIISGKSLVGWIFGKEFDQITTTESANVILNADYLNMPVGTENVLGFLKGSERPDEVIVITSHYDHVGIINGEIHNGADDDGSGTTSVLEIAQAFAQAAAKGNRPKRSILFMCVTGEEKGLLGSQYYVENPIYPLEKTVTNLNIDMVGRIDEKHKDQPNFVYIIGSDKLSKDLHELSEKTNATYTKLELDYTYNDENDPNRFYYRSDHYNFAKNNIPIIFYFNGTHPDYHAPTDTVEKINFEVMATRAQLVFYTAWEIANRKDTIKSDK
jgi:hypothetical protein